MTDAEMDVLTGRPFVDDIEARTESTGDGPTVFDEFIGTEPTEIEGLATPDGRPNG